MPDRVDAPADGHGPPAPAPSGPPARGAVAALVAWAGLLRFRREGPQAIEAVQARSRWPLGTA